MSGSTRDERCLLLQSFDGEVVCVKHYEQAISFISEWTQKKRERERERNPASFA